MNISSKTYPSVKQSIGITAAIIVLMFLLMPIMLELNTLMKESASIMIYYFLVMLIPCILFYLLKKKEEKSFQLRFLPRDGQLLVLLIITTLSIQWGITGPLADLIPMPESVKELFNQMALQMKDTYGFITVAILAPLMEEFIFRGIVLDGLLKRKPPLTAILISSFLFAFVHLNPWQFVGAMLIGLFMGWIYWKTNNLGYTILIHFVNNSVAALFVSLSDSEEIMSEALVDTYGGERNYRLVIATCLLVFTICLFLLKKRLSNSTATVA
jgi:membrane protease YdiL (CAAX protease family)